MLRSKLDQLPPRVWLIVITLLAGLTRFWGITALPPGYWFDEAHKSLVALQIASGERFPIFITDYQGVEAGFTWLLAGFFKLFGPSYFTTRYLAAIIGTATIPITYWSIKQIYHASPRASLLGLLSASLLTFLFWHVLWSRLGLENITVSLFSISCLGGAAWAVRVPKLWRSVAVGMWLGLTQYVSPSARVLPFLVIGALVLLTPNRRMALKASLGILSVAALIYAPLGWFYWQHPEWFLSRMSFVSAQTQAAGINGYLSNLWQTLLAVNFAGDKLARHNLPSRPIFDWLMSGWMLIGLVWLIKEKTFWRENLLVLIAIAVNFLPTVLSDDAPNFGRALGAAPWIIILPALGLGAIWPKAKWGRIFVLSSLLISSWSTVYDYFGRYPNEPTLYGDFEQRLWTLISSSEQTVQENGVAYLYLNDADWFHPTVKFTQRIQQNNVRFIRSERCLVYPVVVNQPIQLAISNLRLLPTLLELFPTGKTTEIINRPQPYVDAALLTLPVGTLTAEASQPGLASFDEAFTLLALETAPETHAGEALALTLRWRADANIVGDYTVFVHLISENNPYWAGSDGEPCFGDYPTSVWHSQEVVQWPQTLSLPANLPPGNYTLAIGLYNAQTGERLPITSPNPAEPDRAYVQTLIIREP